eukprot:TRINITY_DN2566_c0_g1_i1.p1 TRINITY_DN2566_c0_g1~~TRINITY_DN2566_c0_g1_i1.p1  ORF type:complete len:315 (-),score=58.39 TRINITY_DN2566_c0_g1_i1:532-1476(-)
MSEGIDGGVLTDLTGTIRMCGIWGCVKAIFTPRDRLVVIDGKRYRTLQLLGEGGFSFVYLVEELSSGKRYALKKILAQDREQIESAHQEIEVHKIFGKHPNVLKLLGYTTRDFPSRPFMKEFYLLMPHLRGGTLLNVVEDMHKRGAYFTERELLIIFKAICEGIRAFHKHTIPYAHRDIKPGNILLDDKKTPVLMDFGSACRARVVIDDISQAKALKEMASEKCTLPYRPPELVDVPSNCTIDERTDIWSLGCTLYFMAFHYSPFEGPTMAKASLALAIQNAKIPFPTDTRFVLFFFSLVFHGCEILLAFVWLT